MNSQASYSVRRNGRRFLDQIKLLQKDIESYFFEAKFRHDIILNLLPRITLLVVIRKAFVCLVRNFPLFGIKPYESIFYESSKIQLFAEGSLHSLNKEPSLVFNFLS